MSRSTWYGGKILRENKRRLFLHRKSCDVFAQPGYVSPEHSGKEHVGNNTQVKPRVFCLALFPVFVCVCINTRSVGVITYMLITGESPFAGDDKQQTFLNVSQVNVDYSKEAFSRVSELAVHFIRKLLVKAPEWVSLSVYKCIQIPFSQSPPILLVYRKHKCVKYIYIFYIYSTISYTLTSSLETCL